MPRRFVELVVDVLKDHDARASSFGERSVLDFPFEVAAKTGTSKGYRDNWTVGFTRAVTVAVWAGNFDGKPMTNVSGITGAGPLFHALMDAAMRGRAREPLPIGSGEHEGLERVEVCALSGELAGPDCPHRLAEWRPAASASEGTAKACTMHARVRVDRRNGLRAGPGCAGDDVEERGARAVSSRVRGMGRRRRATRGTARVVSELHGERGRRRGARGVVRLGQDGPARIVYPLPGARFAIDPDRPREAQRLRVQIVAPGHAREATLVVDGQQVARVGSPFDASWALREGDHDLVAEVDGARSAAVRVTVRP